ncbi:low molecular weight phosphatase family protein [Variovorax sp. HJSM1_2]|uniref:arsenate-mycothiol transferase ArsC n=1 Tax=Variovorax sp. HJSM1_2 TaxID=3366263 RepID=UPI003BCDE8F0
MSKTLTLIDTNYGTARGLVRTVLGQVAYISGSINPFLNPRLESIERIVFVCLGNINRSAFAEAVASALGVKTCSIGLSTTTGHPAFEKAIQTADLLGFELRNHSATNLTDYEFRPNDLLLAMEIRHAHQLRDAGIPTEAIALLGHWSAPHRVHLHDPHTLSDAYFRTCFTLLRSAVEGLVEDLKTAKSPSLKT